jgi:hypothetical protein
MELNRIRIKAELDHLLSVTQHESQEHPESLEIVQRIKALIDSLTLVEFKRFFVYKK